jgi:hypothetical protein
MHSPTLGLVAQMSGWLTNKCYGYEAVFVDHCSGDGFIHLQKTQSAEGKAAFERHCRLMDHKVLHDHADNGIFRSKARQEPWAKSGQTFTYSGVNAHFQTGVAERLIRELQELARSCMIHAQH